MCLNESLKIQVPQIYGQGKSKLKVKMPYLQQQNNGHDCDLFAVANRIDFAANKYSGLKEGKLQFEFIQNEMREHLVKSLSQKYMEPFLKRTLRTPREIQVVSVDIELLCC